MPNFTVSSNIDTFMQSASYTAMRELLGINFFNVKDPQFGAVGDGVTDDTDAINDAIAAAFNAGGGVVYFPRGHYVCSGDFDPVTNGILTIPQDGTTTYSGTPIKIALIGEVCGRLNGAPLALTEILPGGVTLDFTAAPAGTGSYPAALSGAHYELQPQDPLGGWNNVEVIVNHILFALPSNPTFGVLNFSNVLRCQIGDQVEAYALANGSGAFVEPTHDSFFAHLPQTQCNVRNVVGAVQVAGFDAGIIAAEHTLLLSPVVFFCNKALVIRKGAFPIKGWLDYENCPQGVVIEATTRCVVDLNVESEDGNASWYARQTGGDFVDSLNIARGRIASSAIRVGVGGVEFIPLSVTGGAGVEFTELASDDDTEIIGSNGFWKFNSDLTDSSGSGNTLTNNGSATFAAGLISNAVSLNGTSQYLTQASAGFANGGSMTFTVWVNPDTDKVQVIASEWGGVGGNYRWQLVLDADGILHGAIYAGGSVFEAVSTDTILAAGGWNMATIQIDDLAKTVRVKVDDGAWVTENYSGTLSTSTQPFTIGCNYDGGGTDTPSNFFDGLIDIARLSPTTVSAGTITSLYNGGAGTES